MLLGIVLCALAIWALVTLLRIRTRADEIDRRLTSVERQSPRPRMQVVPSAAGPFLKDLAWPAVAGNVVWTIATLLLTKEESFSLCLLFRLLSLSALAIYLVKDWHQTATAPSIDTTYVIFDVVHLLTIVWVALAIQANSSTVIIGLLALFLWLIFGHGIGAWREGNRFLNALPALLGLVVALVWVFGGHRCAETCPECTDWAIHAFPAAAIWIALFVWLLVRRRRGPLER